MSKSDTWHAGVTTATFQGSLVKKHSLKRLVRDSETYLASSTVDISSRGPLGSSAVGRHLSLLTGDRGERKKVSLNGHRVGHTSPDNQWLVQHK